MKNLPTVSIILPTFNEEKNIKRCLDAVYRQDFPKENLTVWLVDNGSTDRTVAIAKNYPVKILFNRKIFDAQFSKMMAFKKLTSDFFCHIDADIEIVGRDWLKKMLYPLMADPEIVSSFTRFLVNKKDVSLNRFLSYDPVQRDPFFEYLAPDFRKTIVEKRKNYFLCLYFSGKIPPTPLCLHRQRFLMTTIIPKREKLMELDNLEILARAGFNKFAYVPDAGVYHFHVQNLAQLANKRIRNLRRNYLISPEDRYYTWANFNQPQQVLKIALWVVYANLFFPELLRGIYKSFKYRDWACLWQPVVALLVTDLTLYEFLISAGGRKLIGKAVNAFTKNVH